MLKMLPLLSTLGCQDPDVLHIFGASAINSEDEICMTVFWEALKPQSRNFYILLSSFGLASVSFFLSFLFVACTLPISVEDESANNSWWLVTARSLMQFPKIKEIHQSNQWSTWIFADNNMWFPDQHPHQYQLRINDQFSVHIISISYPYQHELTEPLAAPAWTPAGFVEYFCADFVCSCLFIAWYCMCVLSLARFVWTQVCLQGIVASACFSHWPDSYLTS